MRPIILIIDPPDPETLSTRKLVLESAKYNVLTAFTAEEGVEIARRVPVDAMVLHERIAAEKGLNEAMRDLKQARPDTPLVLVSPNPGATMEANHTLNSHEPMALLDLFLELFGVPDMHGNVFPVAQSK